MSPAREAFVLPLLFLTVTLLAGLQVGSETLFTPPSEYALVLACLLVAVLVRSGALAPDRLLQTDRAVLANANGAIVLATLFIASAQLLTMLTPSSGLPLLLFDAFLLVLLVNTTVAAPDRQRALRSLVVICGSAFLIKFVVLASLSNPAGGRLRRVLLALFDVATLGTIAQEQIAPAAGYVAFAAILLYLIAVAALPAGGWDRASASMELREAPAGALIEIPETRTPDRHTKSGAT
jgi:hypothetical protein